MGKRKPTAPPPSKVKLAAKGPEMPYVPPAPQPAEKTAGWIKQITTEADNQTHDAGYVAIFGLGVTVLGAIPVLILLSALAMYLDAAHKFDPQPLGIAIGAICTGFATALGALGLYRMGQNKAPAAAAP